MRSAIFPGSFDPFTFGHQEMVQRILGIFDHVIIAVSDNHHKKHVLSLAERSELIKELFAEQSRVSVENFSGLLVDFAAKKSNATMVRGLRSAGDFDYEFHLASINASLAPDVQSMFLMAKPETFFISSSFAREIASLGGKISHLVPPSIEKKLREKFHAA